MPEPTTALTQKQTLWAGVALLLNSGSTSILGFAYWIVAARTSSPEEVGVGSTLVSTLMVVSGFAQLNYGRTLPHLIPRAAPHGTRVLTEAYGRVLVMSAVLSAAFWALVAVIRPSNFPEATLVGAVLFALGTALWSVFTLQDSALNAFRLTNVIPVENTVYGIAKIVALVAIPVSVLSGSSVIIFSWLLPLVAVVPVINYLIYRRHGPEAEDPPYERRPRGAVGVLDAVGSYAWLLTPLLLQYVVLTQLGPAAAAVLFIPLTLVTSADGLSGNIGNTVTAETTRNGGQVPPQVRRLVLYLVGAACAGAVLMLVLGRPLLALFGDRYGTSSLPLLISFGFSAAARAVAISSAAVQRARGRGLRTMLLQLVIALGPLSAAVLIFLGLAGLDGVAIAWLATSLAAAALAVVYLRMDRAAAPHPADE